jgi:hypothetical protein
VGRYLLIGAQLPEASGRVVARMTGRNPTYEDEDLLRLPPARISATPIGRSRLTPSALIRSSETGRSCIRMRTNTLSPRGIHDPAREVAVVKLHPARAELGKLRLCLTSRPAANGPRRDTRRR